MKKIYKYLLLLVCVFIWNHGYARDIPTTEQFQGMLQGCAMGAHIEVSADLIGSITSIYAGDKTQGKTTIKSMSQLLNLLPEKDRLDAYKLYISCISKFLEPEKKPTPKQRSDSVSLIDKGGKVLAGYEYTLVVDDKQGTLRFKINAENSCFTNEHTAKGVVKISADGNVIYSTSLETKKMEAALYGVGVGGNKTASKEEIFSLPEDVRVTLYDAADVSVLPEVDGNDDICIEPAEILKILSLLSVKSFHNLT